MSIRAVFIDVSPFCSCVEDRIQSLPAARHLFLSKKSPKTCTLGHEVGPVTGKNYCACQPLALQAQNHNHSQVGSNSRAIARQLLNKGILKIPLSVLCTPTPKTVFFDAQCLPTSSNPAESN